MKTVRKTFLLIVVIFLFFSLTKNIFDYQKNLNFYQGYKEDFEAEQKKKITLRTNILKTKDSQELERTMRDKLNLLKPGEITVIIPEPTPKPRPINPTPSPIYQQWLNVLFQRP